MPDGTVHADVQSTIDATRGAGTEPRPRRRGPHVGSSLGDLSDVRVHTDDTADKLNRSVSARAFATGTDVYFAQGEYSPGSASGDKLIAHELAHVVQQRGAAASGPLSVSQPGDAMEREADAVADQIALSAMTDASAISVGFDFIDRRVMAAVERVASTTRTRPTRSAASTSPTTARSS